VIIFFETPLPGQTNYKNYLTLPKIKRPTLKLVVC
jgi:hypothetical protein